MRSRFAASVRSKPQLVRCMLARQLLAIDPDRVLDSGHRAGRPAAPGWPRPRPAVGVHRCPADHSGSETRPQAIHAERLVAVAHGQKDVVLARARGQTNQRWSNDVLQGIDGHGSTPTVGQRRVCSGALRDAVKCAHLAQGSEHSMHRWVGKIQRRRQHCHACTQWSGFGHGQQRRPAWRWTAHRLLLSGFLIVRYGGHRLGLNSSPENDIRVLRLVANWNPFASEPTDLLMGAKSCRSRYPCLRRAWRQVLDSPLQDQNRAVRLPPGNVPSGRPV